MAITNIGYDWQMWDGNDWAWLSNIHTAVEIGDNYIDAYNDTLQTDAGITGRTTVRPVSTVGNAALVGDFGDRVTVLENYFGAGNYSADVNTTNYTAVITGDAPGAPGFKEVFDFRIYTDTGGRKVLVEATAAGLTKNFATRVARVAVKRADLWGQLSYTG